MDSLLVQKAKENKFLVISVPESVVPVLEARGRRLCFALGSVYVKYQNSKGKFCRVRPDPGRMKPVAVSSETPEAPPTPVEAEQAQLKPRETTTADPQGVTPKGEGGEVPIEDRRDSLELSAPPMELKTVYPDGELDSNKEGLKDSFGDLKMVVEAELLKDGTPFV